MDEDEMSASDGSDIEIDGVELDGDNSIGFNGNDHELNRDEMEGWIYDILESDDDESEFEGFQNLWSRENFTPRNVPVFNLEKGSSVIHPPEAGAKEYFELYWDDVFWDRLTNETNMYATQEREKNPPPQSAPKWTPTNCTEMKAFIGMIFTMGIIRLPSRNDYWRASKWLFKTSFNQVRSRDRFNLLWRYLHIQNNAAQVGTPDKLWKLRWMLDYLNSKFKEIYTPYGSFTIDESMVKFKGRLEFRQYMPAKPTKWGIKNWVMAEASTGYMYNFQVYTGREGGQENGLCHRVVTDLCQPLFGTNARVYMDNFYTSTVLLHDLHIRGIHACGTVRANRKGLPQDLLPKNVKLSRHEYRMAQKNELTFCIWQDTKAVTFLSNFHDPGHTSTILRRNEQKVRTNIETSRVVVDYQQNMRGVDLLDQMTNYYILQHRSKKWWRRLFFNLMMCTAYNSYIVARDVQKDVASRKWPNFQDFLEDLAEELIGDVRVKRAAPLMENVQPCGLHSIEKIFQKRKVCRECSLTTKSNERAGATNFGCKQCNIPVHLECQSKHIMRALKKI